MSGTCSIEINLLFYLLMPNFESQPTLNDFAALSPHERASVRRNIQELITTRKSPIYDPNEQSWYLFPSSEVVSHLPMAIGGFTDFSCSLVHMSNVSTRARANHWTSEAHQSRPDALQDILNSQLISSMSHLLTTDAPPPLWSVAHQSIARMAFDLNLPIPKAT